ncbi:MAG: hypothetical protein GC161_18465 [Planctomycetaceae bacterium]|nr:hypothetical protein [Planctomycetaceae bacterium]
MSDPALNKRLALASRMAAAFKAPEKLLAPPAPRETILEQGPFWTVYNKSTVRPFPRIDYDLSLFDEGTVDLPKSPDVLIEWLGPYTGAAGTGYHVTIGNGAPVQLDSYWQALPMAYAGRRCGPWSKLRLDWVEGQPRYPRITIGGPGIGSDTYIAWGTPGVWGVTVGPLLIEAANPAGPRPQVENITMRAGYGSFDGIIWRNVIFTNGDQIGGEPQPYILVPDGQEVGMWGLVGCYIKPRPFDFAGSALFGCKWGIRARASRVLIDGCKFGDRDEYRFAEEHWFYESNGIGWNIVQNSTFATTGRTTVQVVNRQVDMPLSFPNQGRGDAFVLIYNCETDGSSWHTGAGWGGGSAFTMAPCTGDFFIEACTLHPKPTFPSGFQERGGGILHWTGGNAGGPGQLTASGAAWPLADGARTWVDEDGFGSQLAYIGPCNIDVSNALNPKRPITLSNVREVQLYVGPGMSLVGGSPTIGFDHTQSGLGDESAGPILQYNDDVVEIAYEAEKISLYAEYELGVEPPTPGPGANFSFASKGWTCRKPSADGTAGTIITELPWVFEKA